MTVGRTGIPYLDWMCSCVHGCTPESEGCANCFARRTAETRLRGRGGYPVDEPFRVTLNPAALDELYGMRKARRVGIAFMGDLFHEQVPDDFIRAVFRAAEGCAESAGSTMLFLTKRARRLRDFLTVFWAGGPRPRSCPGRIWIGVSVEDQAAADARIPLLLQTPAVVRFVSCEPLLGPLSLRPHDDFSDSGHGRRWLGVSSNAARSRGIDWVVAGGETGPGARPCHPLWLRSLRDQCAAAGVPFWLKQLGEWVYASEPEFADVIVPVNRRTYIQPHLGPAQLNLMLRVGRKAAGRLLDGRTWDELPGIAPTLAPPGTHIESAVEPKPYRPEEG